MNRKQTIDAMAQAFNDADEAGLPLEECWGAALDAVLPVATTGTDAMKAAWDEFKTTKLFSALLAHMSPALMLENEGLLWGIFYNGYMAGGRDERAK